MESITFALKSCKCEFFR